MASQAVGLEIAGDVFAGIIRLVQCPAPAFAPQGVIRKTVFAILNHHETLLDIAGGVADALASLGEQVGMSRATLVRHFRDAIGVAPMTYIANWRLMKAYKLIKYSSRTLDHIALSVGFGSARSMSKSFQRHYGCTPNQLRRRIKA